MGQEPAIKDYNSDNPITDDQIPDDTLTVIIKCGGKIYRRGVNLEETHELTAKMAAAVMQQVVDTVDSRGLKAGGPEYHE